MARKKQNAFEDWVDLIALLPWWAGVLLAVIFYFLLHYFAIQPIAPAGPGQLGDALRQSILKGFATAGQYFVPLVCIAGAAISAWRRGNRQRLFADVRASNAVSVLNDMSWQEFEMLVGEAFRRGGYEVIETGGGGADGGVDLVLRKDGEKYFVQCKQWRAHTVGVTVVRELYGVMAANGAVGGFVVTSGVFSAEAKDFSAGRNIDLMDGAELHEIIRQVQPASSHEEKILLMTGQLCPKCGSLMVMRTARQGVNVGKSFWGCPKFPQCRGIAQID